MCAGKRPYFGFIRLYDDFVVEEHDNTTSTSHEMGDNDFSKSDNIGTQLCLKVTMRVVSTVNSCDRSVTQLLHNKPITYELMSNLSLAVMEHIHFAHSSCTKSATHD